MHDIDRTWNEFGSGEMGIGETSFELGQEYSSEITSPFNEMQEIELAAELLSASNEYELNQFLGNVIKSAGRAVGSFVSSPTGQALGGILKQAAKKALPVIGSAVGGYFGGSTGADLGSKLASSAGDIFGLELEGMAQEDRELEVARKFVRFAGAAVRNALQAAGTQTGAALGQAVTAAAHRYLPELIGKGCPGAPAQGTAKHFGGTSKSGRWYRRGNRVILIGI